MSTRSLTLALLAVGLLLAGQAPLRAQENDPLRFVPLQAHVVVKMDTPSLAIQTLYQHEIYQEALKIEGVRDFFDTTNFRRLLQIRDFYEKKLGVSGYELLERLTSGGAVLAIRTHSPPAALLVIQGKDEALLKRFVQLTVEIAEQELARQESKDKITVKKWGAHDGYQVGKASVALVGSALLVASDPVVLHAALGLADKNAKERITANPEFAEARKHLAQAPLIWAWADLESVRKIEGFKAGLDAVSADPNNLVTIGGLVDVLRRAPAALISLTTEGKGFVLENRLAAGSDGMNAKAKLFLPQDGNGALPLLSPPRTLASVSYFLDLKAFWDNRDKLLNKMQLKALEDADAQSGLFLGGTKLSKLLEQSGPHQRIVVAQAGKQAYKIKPQQQVPSFALVQEMRDPAFGKSMDTVLRAAGLFASLNVSLKMVEEKHGPFTIVSYRFAEDKPLPGDVNNSRFNFSPCFVTVGDQLIISSTAELAHDLIDELTAKKSGSPSPSPSTTQIALYSKGGADALRGVSEQLLAQAILNQALPPTTARKQIESFINFVDRLGDLRFDIRYGQNDFRFKIRWQPN